MIKHGTTYAYKHHGCDCDQCKAAWARAQREYRQRHPEQVERQREYRARRRRSPSHTAPSAA